MLKSEFIYGSNVVLAALKASHRKHITLYSDRVNSDFANFKLTSTAHLDKLANSTSHQGLVLHTSKRYSTRVIGLGPFDDSYSVYASHKELIPFQSSPLWVALDSIVDPQNLGAIFRTCSFFNVNLVFTESNTAPLSPAASRASAGAMERMDLFSVSSLPKFLDFSYANGWNIVGTDLNAKNSTPLCDYTPKLPTILVIGSEGAGLRRQVSASCRDHIYISGQGKDALLDSLNVSVATGVLLNAFNSHFP
jgi:21S rRNA (GM2251-2'-O)-methyltransferase